MSVPCKTTGRTAVAVAALLSALAGAPATAQTPEDTQAWEAQHARLLAQEKVDAERLAAQRAARRADPMAWVNTLNPITAGGWQFRAVASDGSWAAFSTDHQLKRSGHLVTVWLRQEYPEVQHGGGGEIYLSNVEKVQYDCSGERVKALLVIYYTENNIAGAQQTEETEAKQAPWEAIVPGTESEYIFRWACPGT